MICDINSFESIKFLEKQVEKIIKISSSYNNLHLYVNLKENPNEETCYYNLSYLNSFAEKYSIKPNFVNLFEYDNKKDKMFEVFVKNSLSKKPVMKQVQNKIETSFDLSEEQKSNTECIIY